MGVGERITGDEGINLTASPIPGYSWSGTEGTDWDVLWTYTMGGFDNHGSAAIGDVDNDGALEVVVGSQSNDVYVLDGATGTVEQVFTTGSIYASPALANLDNDPYLEIVIGDLDGYIHAFQWDGATGTTHGVFPQNLGAQIYSSAAIGNIDTDAALEIVTATTSGIVYAYSSGGVQEWSRGPVGGFYSSPSLIDRTTVPAYDIEWQMFRNNAMRTGFYGSSTAPLDMFIGSLDNYLYFINGDDGAIIDRIETSGTIHGSPTVGDIDGDKLLNIVFQTWGDSVSTSNDRIWNVEETPVDVAVDIKPQSCPNPVNTKSQGVLPVAIVSDGSFDASQVNPATIELAGVSPTKWDSEDVTTPHEPYVGKEDCYDCSEAGPDGLMDLTLKFDTQEIVAAMGSVEDGQCLTLKLTARLWDGTPIAGEDVVIVKKKGGKAATLESLGGNGVGASVSTSAKGGAGASGPLLLLLGLLGTIAFYIRRKNQG